MYSIVWIQMHLCVALYIYIYTCVLRTFFKLLIHFWYIESPFCNREKAGTAWKQSPLCFAASTCSNMGIREKGILTWRDMLSCWATASQSHRVLSSNVWCTLPRFHNQSNHYLRVGSLVVVHCPPTTKANSCTRTQTGNCVNGCFLKPVLLTNQQSS